MWLWVLSHSVMSILCSPMSCSPSGSSVPGISKAITLEWAAMSSRESSQPRDNTLVSCVSCIGRRILYHKCHLGSPKWDIRDSLFRISFSPSWIQRHPHIDETLSLIWCPLKFHLSKRTSLKPYIKEKNTKAKYAHHLHSLTCFTFLHGIY